jgi:ABC-type branched-subunit amino acid transport system substrate-binding protein
MAIFLKRFSLLILLLVLSDSLAYARNIYLGMSGAFTGPSRSLGIELYRGSKAYFDFINEQGGVNGHKIYIKAYDDGYNPGPALMNTINLVEKDKILLLFNYVGTPTTVRVLPLLQKYSAEHIYLFCPFTGVSTVRKPPYNELVFNLRASYHTETAVLVDNFVRQGYKKIGVFYQVDAYGRDGWQGIQKALQKYGLSIKAEATYRRGAKFTDSFFRQANHLLQQKVNAIICIASYQAAAGFIRDVRNLGHDVPVANISFVDPEAMGNLLFKLENKTGKIYTDNLINTQVVPFYTQENIPAREEYRMCMDKFHPAMPEQYEDGTYEYKEYGAVSFEGFLNAKLIINLLQNMGHDPKRKNISQIIQSLKEIDLGINVKVFYSYYYILGPNKIYFITFKNRKIIPIESFKEFF